MRVNRGSASGGSSELEGGGMSAPGAGSGQASRGTGATRAPTGGGAQREGADQLGSRTDRGNQNDEDIGSSASRGGGGGEINTPRSGNADVTGTTDVEES
jgi:hypothetical protein